MTRSGKQWFVVRTKTGGEVTASIAVAGKGFDVFLPVQLVTRMRNRKREEVSRPLFPRYLFVAFDPARDTHGEINWCRGVANRGLMVTADGRPIPVKDSIIAQIRGEEAARMAKAGQVTTGYSRARRSRSSAATPPSQPSIWERKKARSCASWSSWAGVISRHWIFPKCRRNC